MSGCVFCKFHRGERIKEIGSKRSNLSESSFKSSTEIIKDKSNNQLIKDKISETMFANFHRLETGQKYFRFVQIFIIQAVVHLFARDYVMLEAASLSQ